MRRSSWWAQRTMLALLIPIAGCSTTPPIEEFRAYLNDSKALRLAVQVCLPDKTAYFDEVRVDVTDLPDDVPREAIRKMFHDAQEKGKYDNPYRPSRTDREFQTIRKWHPFTSSTDIPKRFIGFGQVDNVKGIVSYGGKTADLAGSTETNQPIFYAFTHERPTDVVAVNVRFTDENSNSIAYWFRPPKEIGATGYTDWMLPVSEERAGEESAKRPFFWLLTHGKEMPVLPVRPNAPRIRYMLLSSEQYWISLDTGRRAMYLTKLKRLASTEPEAEDRFHLVPAKTAIIPPC